MEDILLLVFQLALILLFAFAFIGPTIYNIWATPIKFILITVVALIFQIGPWYFSIIAWNFIYFVLFTSDGRKAFFGGLAIGGILSWLTTRNWK